MWHPATDVGIWRPSPGRRERQLATRRISDCFFGGRSRAGLAVLPPRAKFVPWWEACAAAEAASPFNGTPVAVEVFFPDLPIYLAYEGLAKKRNGWQGA